MHSLRNPATHEFRVLARPGLGGPVERNPYTSLLYSRMPCQVDDFNLRRAFLGKYNILHVHWPEADLNVYPSAVSAYLKLRRRFLAIDCMRLRGTKVIWTVHNLSSHEGRHPSLERWFWRELLKRLDGFIALTEGGKIEAMQRFPKLKKLPGFVVPHGHYREAYLDPVGGDARGELNLDANSKVILFFGRIRPYKNLPVLIDVFRRSKDRNSVLYIVGPPDDTALAKEVRSDAGDDTRIRIESGFIPRERVYLYFRSADLVVLPYRDILNSGAALLALSFNRPIFVPNLGAMEELAVQIGPEWVRTFTALTLDTLQSAIEWAMSPRPALAPLDHLDWTLLAKQTLGAYETMLVNSHVGLS